MDQLQPKKSSQFNNALIKPGKFLKHYWWIGFIILILIGVGGFLIAKERKDNSSTTSFASLFSKYSTCPSNLSGVLTYQLMDPKYISALTPLGNLNPPGHTSPVDHIYFNTNSTDKISLYAPADATITSVIEIKRADDSNKPSEYVVQYTICKGLVLDFAGYTELTQPLKDKLATAKPKGCSGEIKKEGHESAERQCGFDLNYPVKSGELMGYTQATPKNGNLDLPFEIWAADYNKPAPSNVDWSYYDGDNRYAHIMCPFDLYAGNFKNEFYAKLGGIVQQINKDEKTGETNKTGGTFKPRTIEPICGTINQNIVGTIQGMWFGEGWKNRTDKKNVDNSRQFSFLHWNIDPTYAEIGNAGEISGGQAGQIQFIPNHTGTIDREPSEVNTDSRVYCYNYVVSRNDKEPSSGKILVQLIDDRHLKLEYQHGTCGTNEAFENPFSYER